MSTAAGEQVGGYGSRVIAALAPGWAAIRARPEKVIGWSDCRITDETAAAYAGVVDTIDNARLPFLPDGPLGTGGGEGGPGGGEGGEDGQDEGKPKKRGGRRLAVECACQP